MFVLAIAENAVDALSYKPHNILRSHKGLTVEVSNTDAEGRLVLGGTAGRSLKLMNALTIQYDADALSYAQQRHKPHTIIDMATLTGACIVSFFRRLVGVHNVLLSCCRWLSASTQLVYSQTRLRWPMPSSPLFVASTVLSVGVLWLPFAGRRRVRAVLAAAHPARAL